MMKNLEGNGLVLGIGNSSKPILAACEPSHPRWTFAVLDFWSAVQEIRFVENEFQVAEATLRTQRDLSFFIKEPKLAVRFGPDKYHRSDTQKILRYTVDYRKALRRALYTDFTAIEKYFVGFASVMMVTEAADEIALECFPALIPAIQNAGCDLKALTSFPLAFQGEIVTKYATDVMEMLHQAKVNHYQMFLQNLTEELPDVPGTDLFAAFRQHFSKELSLLLGDNE